MSKGPDTVGIRRAWELKLTNPHMTRKAIAVELGRGRRTIDDWLNEHEIKRRGLEHLMFPADPSETEAMLRSQIEKEAHRKCRLRDHAWMSDSRFEWQGYSVSQRKDTPGKTRMTREIRTCRFCGHLQQGRPRFTSVG